MVDEIQTGFGRTGEWFGFQHAGVAPDVVTMAKAMGNGFPVGACWARREVAAVFQPGDHGSTYSGTAIATAAVGAVIDEMRRIDAPAPRRRARGVPARLRSSDSRRRVGARRGSAARRRARRGPRRHRTSTRALLGAGLVTNAVTPTALRFAPPLTVTEAEIDEAAACFATSCERTRSCMTRRPARHRRPVGRRAAPRARPRRSGRSLSSVARSTGQGAALIFEKPSNRTRQSMEMAVVQLGGHPVYTRGDEVGFDVREPSRTSPGSWRATTPCSPPGCSTTRSSSAWPQSVDVPVVNMLQRPRPPAAGAGRRADDAAGRSVTWRDARSPTSATTTTSPVAGEAWAMLGMHVRSAARLASTPTTPSSSGWRSSAPASVEQSVAPPTRSTAPMPCTPTPGCRWGRRPRSSERTTAFEALHGRRDGDDEGRRAGASSCTACRRTAARGRPPR